MQKPKELWKMLKMSEFRGDYMVSENGKVKKLGMYGKFSGKWMPSKQIKPTIHKKGYARIRLHKDGYKKSFYIHRLVAFVFIPNPLNLPCVNHKDGNKLNNHFSNLEWCTVESNNIHALVNNLNSGNSKVSYQQRQDIRARFHSTPREELMKEYNLSNDDIYRIGIGGKRGVYNTVGKNGIRKIKGIPESVFKPIVDLNTGIFYNSDELAAILGVKRRSIHRLLNEERKPNTTQYRYA